MRSKSTCKYYTLALTKICATFIVLYGVLAPHYAYAVDPAVADAQAQEVSSSIMSPYCPGRTLSSCPSGKAIELRNEIQTWFLEGASRSDVQTRLIKRFGDAISGKPAMKGFGVYAWYAPVIFFISLLVLIFWRLKILRRSEDTGRETLSELSDEEQNTIDKELEERMLR